MNVVNFSNGINYLRFTVINNQFFKSELFQYQFYFEVKLAENLGIKEDGKEKKDSSGIDQIMIVSLGLVASALIGVVLFLHFKNMKKTPKNMTDISFRY